MSDDSDNTLDERRRLGVERVAPTLDPDGRPATSTLTFAERYQSASEIARGGMGRVLVATDTVLGRSVAVKEALALDSESLRRFARETRITARLEHPSIVPVYDAGTTADGSPYYVMRKVSGQPLDQLVTDARTLDQRLGLVGHVLAAAQAVAHAHERGIVHRDLKPTNILVGNLGETVVIDWGLAKVIGEPEDPAASPLESERASAGDSLRTRIGTVFGTPGFMAPEQVRGERVDARGDVYALGATLYYLLARRPPHAAQTGDDMMAAAMSGPPTPIGDLAPGVPRELAAIVDKALAFDDRERYPDGGAFADDLNRFLKGQLVASHNYSTRERIVRFVRRNRAAVAAVVLGLVAVTALGTVAIRRVLVERDRADASAHLASERQLEAEAAKVRAQERAEQLLLTQARTMASADPTAAIGMLKQLVPQQDRWPAIWRHARGIAATAAATGVAMELPGPTNPHTLELSNEGERLVAVGFDGDVVLVDLAQRSSRPIGTVPRGTRVRFAGKDFLVGTNRELVTIVELATGARREIRVPGTIEQVAATKSNVYWTDEHGKLWRIGLAGGDPVLEAAGPFDMIVLSPDERRLAASGTDGLAVFSLAATGAIGAPAIVGPAGAQVFSFDAAATTLAATYDKRLARIFFDGRPPEWIDHAGMIFSLGATPDTVMAMTPQGVKRLRSGELVTLATGTFDMLTGIQTSIRGLQLVHLSGELVLFNHQGQAKLPSPTHGVVRAAANPASPFIVAATPGHLLVWDARALLPPVQRRPPIHAVYGLDRSQFIYVADLEWHWLDVDAGTTVPVSAQIPPVLWRAIGRDDTALFTPMGKTTGDAFLARRGGAITVLHEAATFGVLLVDGSVVLATQRGALVAYDAAGRRRETVVSRKSEVEALSHENHWLAAIWTDGTLWRRNTLTRREETRPGQGAAVERYTLLLVQPDGTVTFPERNRLLVWKPDGTTTVLAELAGEIRGMAPTQSSIIATTADFSTVIVDRKTGQIRPWIASGRINAFAASYEREIAAYLTAGGTLEIADLVAGEHWPVGKRELLPPVGNVTLSGDGRHIAAQLQMSNELHILEIEMPETAEATAEWLDDLTNGVVAPGSTTVSWPR